MIPNTQVMSEKLRFKKVFRLFKTVKNVTFSLITRVVGIAQKSYSTLRKALDIGYKSLENDHTKNLTLNIIKMQLKLIKWWQKHNFQRIFLYYLIIHVFLDR